MKQNTNSASAAVAVMIDVLLAVLLLIAFYFVQESTCRNSPAKAETSERHREATPRVFSALDQPRLTYARGLDVGPPLQASRPSGERKLARVTLSAVRREGGRLVPLVSAREP